MWEGENKEKEEDDPEGRVYSFNRNFALGQ